MLVLAQVLLAAAKVTAAKKVGTPFDELVNQATVLESGAALPQTEPAAVVKPAEHKKGVISTTWERIKGFFTGILVAIIATLYMVRSSSRVFAWATSCMLWTERPSSCVKVLQAYL